MTDETPIPRTRQRRRELRLIATRARLIDFLAETALKDPPKRTTHTCQSGVTTEHEQGISDERLDIRVRAATMALQNMKALIPEEKPCPKPTEPKSPTPSRKPSLN